MSPAGSAKSDNQKQGKGQQQELERKTNTDYRQNDHGNGYRQSTEYRPKPDLWRQDYPRPTYEHAYSNSKGKSGPKAGKSAKGTSKGTQTQTPGDTPGKGRSYYHCYNCGREGHLANVCRSPPQQYYDKGKGGRGKPGISGLDNRQQH